MSTPKTSFLYLDEPAMIQAGVLDIKKCMAAMEEMFRLVGQGDYIMSGHNQNSHGALITYPEVSPFPNMPHSGPDRRFMALPAYLGGRYHITGLKWYGSNSENTKHGLPRSVLMVCLNDADTGEPVALMSANLLSSSRTGAVPGVAAKYLARDNAESLGVVGCGVINRSCTRAMLNNMPAAKTVYIYDIVAAKAEAFRDELQQEYTGIDYRIVDSLEASIVDSDAISIAASGVVKIRLDSKWFKPGSLLTITGSAEFDDTIFADSSVVFDNWLMHKCWLEESLMNPDGIESIRESISTYPVLKMYHEGVITEKDLRSLGDIVSGTVPARKSQDEKIIFFSGGMPVEDLAWGYCCYEEALKQGIGINLRVWDTPHWM